MLNPTTEKIEWLPPEGVPMQNEETGFSWTQWDGVTECLSIWGCKTRLFLNADGTCGWGIYGSGAILGTADTKEDAIARVVETLRLQGFNVE